VFPKTLIIPATSPLWLEAVDARNPRVAEPQVHLFKIPQLTALEESRILAVLSADEQLRARSFRFARDRHAFMAVRASLRGLLAACLDVPPRHLVFVHNEFGKPLLADAPELHFNVSHCHGAAAIALCRDGRIGVDVERVTRERAALEDVRRYFSTGEIRALDSCSDHLWPELFFALWTLKEAYLKAKGAGLAVPLERFGFSLDQGMAEIRLETSLGDRPVDWQFCTRAVFNDYRWSLAVEMSAESKCSAQVIEYR
jgi:4'-phosphopantetheinyl transferase